MAAGPQAPGTNHSPDQYMRISRRLLDHAREMLANGEMIHPSDNAGEAVCHALTAFGKDRGWITDNYEHQESIIAIMSHEFNDIKLWGVFRSFPGDDHAECANIGMRRIPSQ